MEFMPGKDFKPTRKKWPFNKINVDQYIELKDGFNGLSVAKIASAARTYAAKSDVEFDVATVKVWHEYGNVFVKAVQVLRTK